MTTVLTRSHLIKHFKLSIADPGIQKVRCLQHQLSNHLEKSPENLWRNCYVFQSGGMNNDLLYVLYDENMWRIFLADYQKALFELNDNYQHLKIAFVGSCDPRHTLYRVASNLPVNKLILGLQKPLAEILTALTIYKPDILCCYGGFIELLKSQGNNGLTDSICSTLLNTDSASTEALAWYRKNICHNTKTLLTSTEIGVIARTCEYDNYHLCEHVNMRQEGNDFLFDNKINKIQPITNYLLPIKAKWLQHCNCSLMGRAFTLLSGRPAGILHLKELNSQVMLAFHPVYFRSILDSLPDFPGAILKSSDGVLIVSPVTPYSPHAIEERVRACHVKHGMHFNIIVTS